MPETDPAREWQRLTELYLSKYDDELLTLAEDLADLTPIAQQVLQAEIQRRRLATPRPASALEKTSQVPAVKPQGINLSKDARHLGEPDEPLQRSSEFKKPLVGEYLDWIPEQEREPESEGGQVEYIPKVILREFGSSNEARAAKYLLEQAGIHSWIEGSGQGSLDLRAPRLLVAADQLDEANTALPDILPGDLVLEMGQEVQDFLVPPCPSCGAADSLLESSPEAEQVNHWHCESCGRRWEEKLSSSY